MSIPGAGNPLLLGGAGGYKIERSLRFNSADSAYLSRTPASAGNRKTWTWAGWVKLAGVSGTLSLFGAGSSTTTYDLLYFSSGILRFLSFASSTTNADLYATFRLRDPSAWFHLVLSVDTTQAVAANRVRVYVNGTELVFAASPYVPSLNYDFSVNNTVEQLFGRQPSSANYFSGYLAECYLIDGQALTPSSFGETDINGVWQPKAYSGSYGTNGFKLAFADNSAATATTLGKDTSGNSNNWTPNNLSVTAGAGNDSLVDTPTSYGTDTGAGGEVRGNYCTINPLQNANGDTFSNGNLEVTSSVASYGSHTSTIATPLSGKWYAEVTLGNNNGAFSQFGLVNSSSYFTSTSYPGALAGVAYESSSGSVYVDLTSSSYGSAANLVSGDVIGIAYDAGAGTVTFYRNGTSIGLISGVPVRTYYFAGSDVNPGGSSALYIWNFGQRPWTYPANASGFKALCTQNLPAPTITKPSTVMGVALWTGNGSARSITGLGFNPDLVWIKGRSGATDHALYDSVRGATLDLVSNSTAAETTQTQGLTAFNSDGFSLGTLAKVNTNAATYAGWTWDESVSAGFDIVTYTGNGTNRTIAHSLNVAPQLIFVKRRDTTGNWQVYHTSIAASSSIQLNSTAAAASATTVWNSTAPTSTVFSVGTSTDVNANSGTYVAYCFAPVAGYSAFGSYTGNGSADGPMVFTNMRPRWIMLKRTDTTSNWTIIDTSREGYNVDNDPLYPNTADAEGTADLADILSNGFKLRSTDASVNANTGTYVYACFAESPFALARAR